MFQCFVYSDSYEILFEKGTTAFLNKELVKAEKYFNYAAAAKPTAEVYNNLGVVYRAQKKYERSEELFYMSINEDEFYTTAYVNLGLVYIDTKNWDALVSVSEKLCEIDEDNYFGNYGAGYGYYRKRSFKKAKQFLKKAEENFPEQRNREELQYLKRMIKKINKF